MPIDPEQLQGEQLLAATGLEPILRATPSVTAKSLDDADKLLPRIRAMLLRFLGGSREDYKAPEPFKYEAVRKLIDEGDPEQQSLALFEAYPDEVQDDVLVAATRILAYLNQQLPRTGTISTVNATARQPAPVAMHKFARAWNVANRPQDVISSMLQGTVTSDEVGALAAMYPALYESVAASGGILDDAIAAMRSRRGENWDLDEESDRIVKTLLMQDRINADLARDMGAVLHRTAIQQKQGQTGAAAELTSAERLPGQEAPTQQ